MKSKWRSSKFWQALTAEVLGISTVLGVTTAEIQSQMVEAIGQIAGGLIMAAPIVGYIFGRRKAKKEEDS